MSAPLLKTKLFIPSLATDVFARPNLSAQMDAGLDKQLTLVAAPAGSGKTTFISSWVRSVQHPVAWISLDDWDNDPALFWAYVVSGFHTTIPAEYGNFLGQIDISQLPPTRTLLAQLINMLAEIDEKVILVLDDYHVISNSQIHEDIAYLLDHQPPSLHIVLITRADPPLPIASLRGRGLLSEFRAADLRFSLEETEIFLNEIKVLKLAAEDINRLDRRTEGWIIGLQLAAISMQGHRDKSQFVADFSGGHQFILEYLIEEVVNGLSDERRQFLLQTSVLDQVCGPLCDDVLDTHGSGEVLVGLQQDNLFITSLDDDRYWFRYHHLFVDLLGNLLRQEFTPEYIGEIHLRASKWFERNGYRTESIEHAMQAQAFDRAALLIEQAARKTMLHGRLTTLLRWIEALPDHIVGTRPGLRFYRAWALSLGGQPRSAERILLDVKSDLDDLPNSPEKLALRGELGALLTGIITYTNDPPRIIQEANEALTYLPEENLISRSRVHMALATGHAYNDDIGKATRFYQKARGLALKAKNPFLASSAIEMLAGMQIYHQGHLHEAEINLQHVLDMGKAKGGAHQAFTGTAHILLAEINLERNNLDAAAEYLEKGTRLLQQGGIGYSLTHTYCATARLRLATGDKDGAIEALRLADQASQAAPLMHILIHNLACQVKLALHLGDVEAAWRWAMGEKSELPENLPAYLNEVQQISLARVYLAQDDLEKTLETLDHIQPRAKSAGRMVHVIEICLLKALVFQARGEIAAAIEPLKYALNLAAPEGFARKFLEAGRPALKLLQLEAIRNIHPLFANKLLAAFGEPSIYSVRPDVQLPKQSSLVDPLTQRECEVIKLVAAGYTNQQIANALIITLNTVKKHTTHIYGKLGVINRTQAIMAAREFNIIP